MKTALTLLSIPLLTLALSGCLHDDKTSLPPGHYQQTSKSTDSRGTERQQHTTTNVYYDEDGDKKATVDKETSTDPKGLFNKSTTETHETYR